MSWATSRTSRFWLCIALACISFIGLANASIDLAALALLLFLAAAIAQLFRTDLLSVLTFQRRLTWRDAATIALFVVAAFLMLAELIAILGLFAVQDSDVRELWSKRAGRLPVALWPLLSLAPMIALMTRRDPLGTGVSLGAAAYGIAGASILSIGLFFVWIAFGEPVVSGGFIDKAHWISSGPTFGFSGVLIGFGAGLWLHGLLRALGRPTLPLSIFTRTAEIIVAGLILALGITAFDLIHDASLSNRDEGILFAAPLSIIAGVAWIVALWRTRNVSSTTVWRTLLAAILLVFLIPISFFFPLYLTQTGLWAPVVIFVIGPISLVFSVLTAGLIPMLLRRILKTA